LLIISMLSLRSYGGSDDSYPHPELDFSGFITALDRENRRAGKVWDPVSGRASDWVSVRHVRALNPNGKCALM
jgi:hypothetical protein